jgi:hypothetical protein
MSCCTVKVASHSTHFDTGFWSAVLRCRPWCRGQRSLRHSTPCHHTSLAGSSRRRYRCCGCCQRGFDMSRAAVGTPCRSRTRLHTHLRATIRRNKRVSPFPILLHCKLTPTLANPHKNECSVGIESELCLNSQHGLDTSCCQV